MALLNTLMLAWSYDPPHRVCPTRKPDEEAETRREGTHEEFHADQ
jgi:hypothetical protein